MKESKNAILALQSLIVYAISESLQVPGSLSYNGRSMNAPSTIAASLRDSVRRELASIVGSEWVLDTPDELIVYECDGLTLHPRLPDFVVFPTCTEETSAGTFVFYGMADARIGVARLDRVD